MYPLRNIRLSKKWAPYVFISPFFVLFLGFALFPLVFSGYVSFFRWDGISAMKWEGWGNYLWILDFHDLPWSEVLQASFWRELYERDFWRAFYNTLWIGLASGLPQHLVAIPLAYFIHSRLQRCRNVVLAVYFLPFITNTVAIALIFQALFSTQFGIINTVLTEIGQWSVAGIQPLAWLFPTQKIDWSSGEMTRWSVAFVVWWRYVGWNTVLYTSALQTIPKDLYEAARMDGANAWQQFRYVTVPMLRPMIYFAVTLTLIGNLQMFEEPFILTNATGGTGRVAETSAMYMYKIAMTDGDFGTASAIAWLLFVLIGFLTYGNNKLFRRQDI